MFELILVTNKNMMTIPTLIVTTPPWYAAIPDLLCVLAETVVLHTWPCIRCSPFDIISLQCSAALPQSLTLWCWVTLAGIAYATSSWPFGWWLGLLVLLLSARPHVAVLLSLCRDFMGCCASPCCDMLCFPLSDRYDAWRCWICRGYSILLASTL